MPINPLYQFIEPGAGDIEGRNQVLNFLQQDAQRTGMPLNYQRELGNAQEQMNVMDPAKERLNMGQAPVAPRPRVPMQQIRGAQLPMSPNGPAPELQSPVPPESKNIRGLGGMASQEEVPMTMPGAAGEQLRAPTPQSLPYTPTEQLPRAEMTMERKIPDRFEQTTVAQMGQKAGWDPRALVAALAQFSGEFGNLAGNPTSSSAQPYYEQMMESEQKAQAAAQKAREAALDRDMREREMELRYAPKPVDAEKALKMELIQVQRDSLKNKLRVDQEMNDPQSPRSNALKQALEYYVKGTMNIPKFKAHEDITGSDVYKWLGSMQFAAGQQGQLTRANLDAVGRTEDQAWREQESEKQRKFQAEQGALNRQATAQRQDAALAAKSQAKPGEAEKPLTQDERRRQQQVLQMEASEKNLGEMTKRTDFTSRKYLGQSSLPVGLKFGDWQQYENEAKRFVENILRLRTGAAVSQAELESQFQQMFPMPGDDASEVERKQRYRQSIIDEVRAAGRMEPTAAPSTAPAKKVKSIKDIIGG
jgi:hypothetical protein